MDIQILYQFPVKAPKRKLPRAWLLQEKPNGILAIAYIGNKVQTVPFSCSLSLYLLDLETGRVVKEVTASYALTDIEVLHLAYDSAMAAWTIGDLEYHEDIASSFHVVIRLIQEDEHDQLVLSEPIFDEPANEMAPIGPIFALQASNKQCILLYRKSAIDCTSTPEICLERIDTAIQHAEQSLEDYAESALFCQQENTALLLALVPLLGETSQKEDGVFTGSTRHWGFSVTVYDDSFDTIHRRQDIDLRMPAGDKLVLVGDNDFEWLGINACVIAGPRLPKTGQQTFVVGITMMDIFDYTGYGHSSEEASRIKKKVATLLCMSTRGEIVQRCTDVIGLRVHLCQVQSMVVGVDLVEGQWRLWNWAPLGETSFQTLVWLDQQVQRAHVVAGKGEEARDGSYFWLIEESSEWVRVSKHDTFTLKKIHSDVTLANVHLLLPQYGSGSLDWHTPIEVMIYQDTLLLLGVDKHDHLVLYQVK